MLENTLLTVVDINAGVGGRSRVFQDLGFRVLVAVEDEPTYKSIFQCINSNIPYADVEPNVKNLECIPKADIVTANINPLKFHSRHKENPHELSRFLSQLLLRDAPKAFVFQASSLVLRDPEFRFLDAQVLRRYYISYRTFKESDYSGFPTSNRQLYIIGIRNDIGAYDFDFPAPPRSSFDLADFWDDADTIDPWYRRLPNKLVFDESPEAGRIYVRNHSGELKIADRISQSIFATSFYCDEYGLRRLSHKEYAALKGYDRYPYDYNNHSNRFDMYRMLFSATNIYLFNAIANVLKTVLFSNLGNFNPDDWPTDTKPAKIEKTNQRSKKDKSSERSLIKPRNRLLRIHIDKLKGLINLDIDFSKNLTAIMGVNCSGKSTVLHALACVFQPIDAGNDHKFNYFFTPNPDALWNDSKLSITYLDENTQDEVTRNYQKKSDRWSPKYTNRPKREVFFMGIDSCSPEIEKERQTSYISYATNTADDRQSEHIKSALSFVMDKEYTEITNNKTSKKTMIGVCTADAIRYSALSMGAGEQRVFKILQLAYSVPAFSLILIDEIDLLLHVKALERLIKQLSEIATQRKLQIVFTTHSLAMRNLTSFVDIQYLFQTKDKTMTFNTITPDIVRALTNESERPLTVYVEDDLAETVVQNIISEMGLSRCTEVKTIGSSENAFTLAAGFVLQEDATLPNKLIVLDGDVYRSKEEKEKQIDRKLSGTEADHSEKTTRALSMITQLCIPENTPPEKHIHTMIIESGLPNDATNEILYCAKQISVAKDTHAWVDGIVEQMNQDRKVALFQIIKTASLHKDWGTYVANVYDWLKAKKEELKL